MRVKKILTVAGMVAVVLLAIAGEIAAGLAMHEYHQHKTVVSTTWPFFRERAELSERIAANLAAQEAARRRPEILRAQLTANAARKVSGSVTLRGGEYYEGRHWAGEVELAWKPNRHLNLYVSQLQDHIRLPGGDFIVRLMSAGVTVAFDSHWSWTNVAQYDNVSEVLGVNSRGNPNDSDPASVMTGIEVLIPLSLIGGPTSDIKVVAFINGASHDFMSNQILGPAPALSSASLPVSPSGPSRSPCSSLGCGRSWRSAGLAPTAGRSCPCNPARRACHSR